MTALLDRPNRAPVDRVATLRSLASVALGPALTTVAVLTAGVLVVLVAGGIDLGGTAAVVAAAWLGAHQVPITITGTTLGVLPLLPTVVLVWVTGRGVAASEVRGRRCAWVAGAAVVGPVLVAAAGVGVLTVAPGGVPVGVPEGAGALVRVAAVHALGAALGLARPSGQLARLRRAVPGWAWSGLVRVPEMIAVLLAAGAVLTTLALVRGISTAAAMVGTGGGAGGALGLVLLSAAYLPNVAIGALAVAVGPGAVLGTVTVTAFGAVPGPVPALPVLAVLPAGSGAWWWPVVLVVPAAVGALLGLRVLRAGAGRNDALRSVGLAALLTGILLGALGEVAGGGLGTFSPVGVPAPALAVATAAWLGIVGCATVLALEHVSDAAEDPTEEGVDGPATEVVAHDGTAEEVVEPEPDVEPVVEVEDEPDRAPEPGSVIDLDAEAEHDAVIDVDAGIEPDAGAEPGADAGAEGTRDGGTGPRD